MVLNRQDILEYIKKLPPPERELLVHEIWQTMAVDPDDPPLSPAWQAEIRRRIDELNSGRVKAVPYEEAMAQVRTRLEEQRRTSP